MKKYTFRVLPAMFNHLLNISYDEVQHKILNEDLEEIRIIILANDLKEGFEKAKLELTQIIAYNFSDLPTIDSYNFRLKVIEIQDL